MSTENKRDTNPGNSTLKVVPERELNAAKAASRRNAGIAVAATGVAVLAGVAALNQSRNQQDNKSQATQAFLTPGSDGLATNYANLSASQAAQGATLAAIIGAQTSEAQKPQPTPSLTPSLVPTEPAKSTVATPTKTELPTSSVPVIPQELNANSFRENVQTEPEVWERIINSLIQDYAKKDSLKGTNSMLTTLTNLPAKDASGKINFRKDFDKDPEKEPGLGHNDKDIANYKNIYTLNDATTVLSLARSNEVGLNTFGFYGNTNDRDTISYYAAAAITALKHPTEFQATTIADLKAGKYPAAFEAEIASTQNEIFKRIQKQFLPVSTEEKDRRDKKSDGTSLIPELFRKSDQYITCPVYMRNAKTRELQYQGIRQVIYTDGGQKTFTSADSGQAGSLMAFSFDPETQTWGVRSEGNRYYPTNKYDIKIVYSTNANGEQEIVCGVVTPVTSAPQAGQSGQPGQPVNETTPIPSVPSVTPARTQPVQPTRTPGGNGATPIVNTPRPTEKPTEQTQPTMPPISAPSSTPSF